LAIGIVEGLVTATIVSFIWKVQPEILESAVLAKPLGSISVKKVIIGLGIAAVLTGGAFSWFASAYPDGLEWSMFHTSGKEELESKDNLHRTIAAIQEKTSILPDYSFQKTEKEAKNENSKDPAWPDVNTGTSVSGLVGGGITLLLAGIIGLALWFIKKTKAKSL
jgi:cobalt/nickel transport system permease protein